MKIVRRIIAVVLLLSILTTLIPLPAAATAPSTQASRVQSLFNERSYGQHPRLIADEDDFSRVRKLIKTDPYMMHWYDRLYQYALSDTTF